jgi:UDP-2,3-diacylglucosamine pyrophosphatase LpxH
MLFRYQITLELDVEFEAPLLGADNTKHKRKYANSIAKKILQEMTTENSTSKIVDNKIEEDNFNGRIKGHVHLGKSDKNKY